MSRVGNGKRAHVCEGLRRVTPCGGTRWRAVVDGGLGQSPSDPLRFRFVHSRAPHHVRMMSPPQANVCTGGVCTEKNAAVAGASGLGRRGETAAREGRAGAVALRRLMPAQMGPRRRRRMGRRNILPLFNKHRTFFDMIMRESYVERRTW